MSQALLNLSTRPFVNLRPVVRLSAVLWVLGALLLAGNLWLYWDFLVGRGDVDARRREAGEAIAVERRRIEALSSQLAGFELAAQNEQVRYLNQRIEQRRFSWSRLFDEIAGLLPDDVRLTSLQPTAEDGGSGRLGRSRSRARVESGAVSEGQVLLKIEGHARADEAILAFVDALFADEDFEGPNLLQQTRDRGGPIRFDLEVFYQPRMTGEPEVLSLGPDPEPEGEAETAAGAEAEAGAEVAPAATGMDRGGGGPVPLGLPASSPRELT